MTKWQIVYSPQANEDLKSIRRYIAYNLQAADTARKQADRIMDAIDNLDEMPNKFSLYEKEPWYSRGVRKLIVDNFIAFYLPIEDTLEVYIISIMYAGRNAEEILSKNDYSR